LVATILLKGADMQLPVCLSKPPMTDAVAEVRFNSKLPDLAVPGIVWDSLREQYQNLIPNQYHQIPAPLKSIINSELSHFPEFILENEESKIDIGAKTLVFRLKNYTKWEDFLKALSLVYLKISKSLQPQITRIGLRYVNKFDFGLFDDKVNIAVVCDNQTDGKKCSSTIDIDAFVDDPEKLNCLNDNLEPVLNEIHAKLKEKFFSMLSPEFIKELE